MASENDVTTVVLTKMELDTTQAVKASEDLEKQQDKTADATEDAAKATTDYTGALDGMLNSLGFLPAGLTKGLKGVTGLSKGFKGLKAAIIATGIGALIISLTAMYAWFQRTEEGANQLSKIMAYMGQIIDVLIDTFADLGGAIFNAFSDPKKAITDLWEFIKTNLVNRVKAIPDLFGAIGRSIQAAFKFDWDTLTDEIKNAGTAIVQFSTGFDGEQQAEALDKIKGKWEEITETANEAVALQERANNLERARIASITTQAELQRDISNARLEANKATNGNIKQLEESNKALNLTKELYAERIALQQEEVDILEERQALGHNTIADNRQMQEEKAKLIALEKQQDDALRSITLKNETLLSQIIKQGEAKTKATQDAILANEAEIIANQEKLDKIAAQEEKARLKREAIEVERAETIAAINQDEADRRRETEAAALDNSLALMRAYGSEIKAFAIADVIISTARSIAKTAGNLGFPAAIPGIVFAGALGITQLAAINREEFALGGMLRGRSHAGGGIPIEAEGGEAILNKVSMSNPALRSLASSINEWGGGVAFAQKGMLVGEASQQSAFNTMSNDMQRAFKNAPPVLVREDFHRVDNAVRVKEEIATM